MPHVLSRRTPAWKSTRMPWFFFDVHNGKLSSRDEIGDMKPDREHARWIALDMLSSIVRDELPDSDQRDFSVHVRDEDDRVIFTATLTLVTRWMD